MGFSSMQCVGCDKSILAPANLPSIIRWMNKVVSIRSDGVMISGHYDGYGRLTDDTWPDDTSDPEADEIGPVVVGDDFDDDGDYAGTGPTVWHQACWAASGHPPEYRGCSEPSTDQGFFFDEEAYGFAEPKTANDVAAIKAIRVEGGERVS